MKRTNRILSTLLAVIMLLGMFSGLGIEISAATTDEEVEKVAIEDYIKHKYENPEQKFDSMTEMLSRDGFELRVDRQSGEVAIRDTASGSITFSNPYDVGSAKASEDIKGEILSQIVVSYSDNTGSGKKLYSYKDAALSDQVSVQKIKNGVRVEYTIGREDGRKLVPRMLLSHSYDEYIAAPIIAAYEAGELTTYDYQRMHEYSIFWTRQCIDDVTSAFAKEMIKREYPICGEVRGIDEETGKPLHNILYVFNEDSVSQSDLNWCETMIKMYCVDYTFEQMDADHEECDYEGEDEQYPVFKMALEYSLNEKGLVVRLPCNGLRYDMAKYTLENISILPYFGAGNSLNADFEYTYENANGEEVTAKTEGYNFFPDGAGSLFDYGQLAGSTTQISAGVYGPDFAYHSLVESKFQKIVRYPIYGAVSSEVIYDYSYSVLEKVKVDGKEEEQVVIYNKSVSNTVMTPEQIMADLEAKNATLLTGDLEDTVRVYQRGYVAIMDAGESMANVETYHAGTYSDYNTLRNYYNPKPKDSFNLADSISVVSSGAMTVVSDRKYTGSLTLRYIILCDDRIAAETKATEGNEGYTHYSTSWLGMAEAYRDYLCESGVLQQISDEEVRGKDIPLYVESFGALETLETIATIPVNVMTPLTTFANVYTMYTELAELGVKNINFKLTGFANGGMYYTVPYNLKWENNVGGKDGFNQLIGDANWVNGKNDGSHLGLYPDFDFAYIQNDELFDGVYLDSDAVKTIDNRYTSYRQYSATQQAYTSFYQLAISPSRYSKFYNKLMENYGQHGMMSMSVASLGSALNSDFDEEDPYNREDSKEFTKEALAAMKDAGYSLMTDGGNAYTWGYVDHILNVDLDSSRYIKSSASVPFIGAVLHGYVQFAGAPFNEEGNTDYAMLRAIENGANLYFVLSYQNTSELKADRNLSQYYSVRYDIWLEDVAAYYNELNILLKDVQNKVIVDHQFLVGERVLDLEELEADIADKLNTAEKEESKVQEDKETEELVTVADAWATVANSEKKMQEILNSFTLLNQRVMRNRETLLANRNQLPTAITAVFEAYQNIDNISEDVAEMEALQLQVDEMKQLPAEERNEEEIERLQARIDEINQVYGPMTKVLEYAIEALGEKVLSMKAPTVDLMNDVFQSNALLKEATDLMLNLDASIELVKNTHLYNEDGNDENGSEEAVRAKLLEMMAVYAAQAKTYMNSIQSAYDKYTGTNASGILNPNNTVAYALGVACNAIKDNFYNKFNPGGAFEKYSKFYEQFMEDYIEACGEPFTEEQIMSQVKDPTQQGGDKEDDVQVEDRYVIDNNQIVLVVYGDRDMATHNKTAYKGFILNYNTYAVRVTYDGITYTIPSGGYVVITQFAGN